MLPNDRFGLFNGQQLATTRQVLVLFQSPNKTTTEIGNITTPQAGMIVFDETISKLKVYTGSGWETITSS